MSDLIGGFGSFASTIRESGGSLSPLKETVSASQTNGAVKDRFKGSSASGAFLCEDDLQPSNEYNYGDFTPERSQSHKNHGRPPYGTHPKKNASIREQSQYGAKKSVQSGWGDFVDNNDKASEKNIKDNWESTSGWDVKSKDNWESTSGWDAKSKDSWQSSKDVRSERKKHGFRPNNKENQAWANEASTWNTSPTKLDNDQKSNFSDGNNKRDVLMEQYKREVDYYGSRSRREFVETNRTHKAKVNVTPGGFGSHRHSNGGDAMNSVWFEHDDRDGNDGQKQDDSNSFPNMATKVANPNQTPIGTGSGAQFGKIHVQKKLSKLSTSTPSVQIPDKGNKLTEEHTENGWNQAESPKVNTNESTKQTKDEWEGWNSQTKGNIDEPDSDVKLSAAATSVQAPNYIDSWENNASEEKVTVPEPSEEFEVLSKNFKTLNISSTTVTQQNGIPKPNVSPFSSSIVNVRTSNVRISEFRTNKIPFTPSNVTQQGSGNGGPVVQKYSESKTSPRYPSWGSQAPIIVQKKSPQPGFIPFAYNNTGASSEAQHLQLQDAVTESACTCNRPDARIICVTCGFEAEGRVHKSCPIHPKRRCLADRTNCGDGECRSTNIIEVPMNRRNK